MEGYLLGGSLGDVECVVEVGMNSGVEEVGS